MEKLNRIADVNHRPLESWLEEREKDAQEYIKRQRQRTTGAGAGSDNGQPANFIALAEDITERRQRQGRRRAKVASALSINMLGWASPKSGQTASS
jgi:hypothetical protein